MAVARKRSNASSSASVHTPVDLPPATIERAVDRLPAPIEAAVDAAAAPIEPLGGQIVAASFGATGRAVEAGVDAVAAHVEQVLGAATAPIEPLLDAIAARFDARGRVRGNLHSARQQPQTEPYCAALHSRPPSPMEWFVAANNGPHAGAVDAENRSIKLM
jgi:hypothetical protein